MVRIEQFDQIHGPGVIRRTVFRRAEGAPDEPVASSVHRIRHPTVVLPGRHVCRGPERVDPDKADHGQPVQPDHTGREPVPNIPDGAAHPGAAERPGEADGPVHRAVRVHRGHQPPSGHGQVPQLSQVREERGHHAGAVQHRYAGAIGVREPPDTLRERRPPAVPENGQTVRERGQQIVRHTGRSGQQKGNRIRSTRLFALGNHPGNPYPYTIRFVFGLHIVSSRTLIPARNGRIHV